MKLLHHLRPLRSFSLRQVFSPAASLFTDFIDFTVAVYWTMDIVGTFFTAYYSPKGELVRSHRQIAWHYLTLGDFTE